jgi:hypothetical protein
MGDENITIELNLTDFFDGDEEEKNRMKTLFHIEKVDSTDGDLEEVLKKIVAAAISEYKGMLLGMGIPSRADEIMQQRLFLLIENYFENQIPSEEDVSSMFQLTQTRSRSLIRNVLTKYHYQLKDKRKETLKEILLHPIKDRNNNNICRLIIPSDIVVEELNRTLSLLTKDNPDLEKITKVSNSTRVYFILKASHKLLCDEFEISPQPWP